MMRMMLLAGLALMVATTGAMAQLQIGTPSQPSVNAWDALEDGLAKSVHIEGCTQGACTIRALVLDNPAMGDCIEDVMAVGGYSYDGRTVFAAEVAVKVDAEAIYATRYYRALVRFPRAGLQRLCVRRSMQLAELRYAMALERPESVEQLAQSAGVSLSNNRSATELRLAPLAGARGNLRRATGSPEEMAAMLLRSDSAAPIAVAIRSGDRLPIQMDGQGIGYTDKTMFIQPNRLPKIHVVRGEEKVAISRCDKSVEESVLIVRC